MSLTDGIGARLLEDLRVPLQPPIDVAEVARRLGVASINQREMAEEGRLERRGDDVRIYTRVGLSHDRQRFTIAHEIAHLILAAPDVHLLVAHRDRLQVDDEERLCDRIAAGIILPAPWVRHRFGARAHNLSTVRHVAHIADVSMAAAAVRLSEVCSWPLSLLRWRRTHDRWVFLAGAAVPPSLFGAIRSAPATGEVLDRVGARTRRDRRVDLPLLVGDRPAQVPAQVSVNRTSALALANLSAIRRSRDTSVPRGEAATPSAT